MPLKNLYCAISSCYLKIYFITLICVFYSIDNISGQQEQLHFKHLTVDDGLAQNWVKCIFQDSYGYIWFGTGGNGVNKYDGYDYTLYINDPSDPKSLTNNWINIIYEDKNQQLWIGTQHGLNFYDRKNDQFIRFPFFQDNYVVGLYESESGTLYVSTNFNVYEISSDRKTVIPFCNEERCFEDIFNGPIVKDYKNNLWLISMNGLHKVDLANRTFQTYRHEPGNSQSLPDNALSSVCNDSKNRVWLGTVDHGICRISYKDDDPSSPVFITYSHNPADPESINRGMVRALIEDRNGRLWVGTENRGLNILDLAEAEKGKASFTHFIKKPFEETTLSNNSIYTIYQDIQGIIWIGTYSGGINYFHPRLQQFEHYKRTPHEMMHGADNTVNCMLEENNQIWMGTEGGLYILGKDGEFKNSYVNDPLKSGSISANSLWCIYKDSHDNMWIGTWAGGLNLYNRSANSFKHFRHSDNDPFSISSDNIFAIREDKAGNLWIGTMGGGLNKYIPETNRFIAYRSNPEAENSISGNWVQALLVYDDREMWISTSDGLDILDLKTERFINFRHNSNNSKSISYDGANVIFVDSKKQIWLGTDGGLNYFVREDSSFIYYNEKDGLPNNSIKSICEDSQGNLWISTNRGLCKFINGVNTPQVPKFKNYNKSDGLQGNEFSSRSSLQGSDGRIYFGGTNGFNVFYADSIKDNAFIPKVTLTGILIFNKPVAIDEEASPLKSHISITEKLVLNHRYSMITLKYAALNFILPEKNKYKYIMEGFDKEWNDVGYKREATYTNLPPGEYIFRVIASNNDDHWNNKGVALNIVILPPWWRTWWFRMLLILFIASCIVIFFYIRLRQLRYQKIQLEKMVKSRTHEIQEQKNILLKQTDELNEINTLLEERQQRIEEQSEELRAQAEELYLANTKLMSLNATKDKFFSIIAHDLKNPFNSILGFCEVLLVKYDQYDDSKKKQLLGVVFQSAQHVYKLLENLLQWARSQTGSIRYEPEEFDLEEIISSNASLMENQLAAKELEIALNVNTHSPVYADKNMINTVVRNLINNSIKFSEKGLITILIDDAGKFVQFTIHDSGIGMDAAKVAVLFEAGALKSTEGTRGETGTGLGLIICKEFIERNGGIIEAKSEINKGSTFIFTIPKAGK